ncbi:unnamed protein product [Lepeophtheirus salmonis]|uniref:(salmon louse) hypothetical protein n=1 Tax=Lepeophtheirus salmonis TaxID=72036 RepID=A0A7R8CFX7_LEPSM|nr:unnamed protein product [Lepeophtheirus salmonis]CAF2763957.1 unnamed protein product [Lepeophtheirus salmonis]
MIEIQDWDGLWRQVRALIDSGSDTSLITIRKDLLSQLGLNGIPEAKRDLFEDTYIYVIATSVESDEVASKIMMDVDRVLHCGGFKIKRWYSSALSSGESCAVIPVLVHNWDVESDYIRLGVRELAPVLIVLRIVFESLWVRGIDRDTVLEEKEAEVWKTQIKSQELLKEVQIISLRPKNVVGRPEIHGFADGGELAYVACVLLRWRLGDGSFGVSEDWPGYPQEIYMNVRKDLEIKETKHLGKKKLNKEDNMGAKLKVVRALLGNEDFKKKEFRRLCPVYDAIDEVYSGKSCGRSRSHYTEQPLIRERNNSGQLDEAESSFLHNVEDKMVQNEIKY